MFRPRIKKAPMITNNISKKHVLVEGKHFLFLKSRRTFNTTPTKDVNYPSSSLMAKSLLWANLILPMPVIASTMYRHYVKGPPVKSWSLSADITIAVIRNFLSRSNKITVENIQKITTTKKLPVPSGILSEKFTVPNEYRKTAGDTLKKVLTESDEKCIDWDWEKDRDTSPPIKGEWLQSKENPSDPCKESTILYLHGGAYYIGCYGMYRPVLGKLIKYFKGRTCAIDYRLAPQHPFPAAVEDALATYLYLIDPPKQHNVQPIDPKKIVIAGDSAGGGLTFALLMAIRDAGLPAPAGAMTLSPWLDLTHSLPSIISNIITDYLPPIGFKHAPSPALDYAQLPQREQDVALLERAQAEAKSSSDDDLTIPRNEGINTDRISIGPFGESVPNPGSDEQDIHRVQFYASNNALKVPLVSPIFDRKHLRGLPPLLLQCGSAERLRDESIYASLMASDTFPGANENSINDGKPTQVALEIYEDQPHVFQLLFSNKATSRSLKNLAAFARDVTNSPAEDYKKQDRVSYVTDNIMTIRNISYDGKTTDGTAEIMDGFTKEKWDHWKSRLERPSIKERMDDVSEAFAKIVTEQNESISNES